MGGEIGLKIAEIKFSDDNVAPYKDGWRYTKVAIDATLIDENGDHFHICGDNDWIDLSVKAMLPFVQAAIRTENLVRSKLERIRKEENVPAVIRLGKDPYRQMNLMHILRSGGDSISTFDGVPVIRGDDADGVEIFLESAKISKMPFD